MRIGYFKILIITLLIFAIISVSASTSLADNVSNNYDFVFPYDDSSYLADSRHSGKICVPCHNSLFEREKNLEMIGNCACHSLRSLTGGKTSVDMQEVKKIHDNKICIRCHIGKVASIGKDEIHEPHLEIACNACHVKNELLIRPNSTNCNDCHLYGPHAIHRDLENLCVYCHGKYGWDTARELDYPSNSSSNISTESVKGEQRPPTIGRAIKFLINSILEVLW